MVEDEVLIRLVIADYLRDCGYRVHEAVSAEEAILILQAPEVSIDIVFSDVEMPGEMDGFGLARWVRANKPENGGHPHIRGRAVGGYRREPSAKPAP